MEKSKGQVKDKQRRDAAHSTIAEGKTKFQSGDDRWHESAREYGIEIILNRIRSDLDLRKRVRKLLAELPADSPGRTSSISGKFVIKAVEQLVASGISNEEAYRRLSYEGVSAEAIKSRYLRSKKGAGK